MKLERLKALFYYKEGKLHNRVSRGSAKKDAEAWEIIDGQQRLTTLYILYKYIITKCNISAESLKEDEIELYHLTYATRKGSSVFLANIGNNDDECNDNIDYYILMIIINN